MSEIKWRTRYERQLQANNLLSDRLRTARANHSRKEVALLKNIRQLKEDNQKLLTDALVAQVDDLPEVEDA